MPSYGYYGSFRVGVSAKAALWETTSESFLKVRLLKVRVFIKWKCNNPMSRPGYCGSFQDRGLSRGSTLKGGCCLGAILSASRSVSRILRPTFPNYPLRQTSYRKNYTTLWSWMASKLREKGIEANRNLTMIFKPAVVAVTCWKILGVIQGSRRSQPPKFTPLKMLDISEKYLTCLKYQKSIWPALDTRKVFDLHEIPEKYLTCLTCQKSIWLAII